MTSTNIFTETISRIKSPTTIAQIINDFKEDVRLKSFRKTEIRSEKLMKKYLDLEKKQKTGSLKENVKGWHQNQRKLFLSFLLAYCKVHLKRTSEISEKEWNLFSRAFHNKSTLLMKYEAKVIERNSDRVHWAAEQEVILQKCMTSKIHGKWSKISKILFITSEGRFFKDSKQIREHWFNHMDQSKKKGQWTTDQDLIILKYVKDNGKQWSKIAQILGGNRTQHMTKNRFYSMLNWSSKLFSESENYKQHNKKQIDNQVDFIAKLIDSLEKQKTKTEHDIDHQRDLYVCKIEIDDDFSDSEEEDMSDAKPKKTKTSPKKEVLNQDVQVENKIQPQANQQVIPVKIENQPQNNIGHYPQIIEHEPTYPNPQNYNPALHFNQFYYPVPQVNQQEPWNFYPHPFAGRMPFPPYPHPFAYYPNPCQIKAEPQIDPELKSEFQGPMDIKTNSNSSA